MTTVLVAGVGIAAAAFFVRDPFAPDMSYMLQN